MHVVGEELPTDISASSAGGAEKQQQQTVSTNSIDKDVVGVWMGG